jgi:hypothetical protein
MAITITWSVLDMKRDATTGGVKEVRWQCVAEADTGESAVEAGKYTCTPDPDDANFVAFEDLTQDVVLGWVKDSDDVDATAIEENRKGKVEAQIARKTAEATGLPWASA